MDGTKFHDWMYYRGSFFWENIPLSAMNLCFTRKWPSVSTNMEVHQDISYSWLWGQTCKAEACPHFPLLPNNQNTFCETSHTQNLFRWPWKWMLAEQLPFLAMYWINSAACNDGVSMLLRDNFFSKKKSFLQKYSFYTCFELKETFGQKVAHSCLGLWGGTPGIICITLTSLKREHVLKWKPAGPALSMQQLWNWKHSHSHVAVLRSNNRVFKTTEFACILWKFLLFEKEHSGYRNTPWTIQTQAIPLKCRFKIQCNLLLKRNKAGVCQQPSYSYSALGKYNFALFDEIPHSFGITDTF